MYRRMSGSQYFNDSRRAAASRGRLRFCRCVAPQKNRARGSAFNVCGIYPAANRRSGSLFCLKVVRVRLAGAEAAYLTSSEYCVRGAIYVKSSAHTVCGLTNGSKASQTLQKAGIAAAAEVYPACDLFQKSPGAADLLYGVFLAFYPARDRLAGGVFWNCCRLWWLRQLQRLLCRS